MELRNVIHRGLKRFIEKGDPAGLPPQYVERIRNIVTYLLDMGNISEAMTPPKWGCHQLKGGKNAWAVTVSRNWRITFRIEDDGQTIADLNYEDYH